MIVQKTELGDDIRADVVLADKVAELFLTEFAQAVDQSPAKTS